MKDFKTYIEAIELSKARKYVKGWNKDRLKDWFNNKNRVYVNISSGPSTAKDLDSEIKKEIDKELKNKNFEVKDYQKGLAYDKKNKRDIKIGKVLNKLDKKLLERYTNDPTRTSSKISEPMVVISRHPYDIAGQSYDRGWTSCKNISGGSEAKYVAGEVHSTLIAYLIYKNDKNIKKPIARLLINQFYNSKGKQVYIPQISQHGSAGIWEEGFAETVEKWLRSKQGNPTGTFKLNAFQYADSLEKTITLIDKSKLPDWVKKSKNVPKKFGYKDNNFLWKNGTWKNGTWKYSWWFDGTWEKGIWQDGIWKDGTWKDGIWKDGIWYDGTWEGGTWRDGKWQKGTWKNGTWEDGIWQNGTWSNGTWVKGTWYDGAWYDGTWKDGIWKNGSWVGGFWKEGKQNNSTWHKGTWENGTWEGGIWKDGIWKEGAWENGLWKNGTWHDGTWRDGTWEKGTWKHGQIWDSDLKKYVKSSVSPKEYFAKKKKKTKEN